MALRRVDASCLNIRISLSLAQIYRLPYVYSFFSFTASSFSTQFPLSSLCRTVKQAIPKKSVLHSHAHTISASPHLSAGQINSHLPDHLFCESQVIEDGEDCGEGDEVGGSGVG